MKKNLFLLLGLALLFISIPFNGLLLAQVPQDLPQPDKNEPLDFSNWPTIVTFIIIPVLLLALYFWLKRKRRKDRR